ncbi:MAG: biotin--[acetyl-CoA-carboxylase] ligase [Planctomycetes bacterium]|nr:biotin--[acetyl-CoA-carboxylase] ligase [Planctomycetota bacterium]
MQVRILRHEIVDSTSERAFTELAAGHARHGDLHVARGQSAGRGRRGRGWHSARDEGLYASLVLLPPPPPLSPVALTLAGGLALLDCAQALFRGAHCADPGLGLEWPNDLVLRGAKLGGVLVETRGLDPARPHYVVGMGLNVRQREFPPELLAERAVASFALAGLELAPERALEELCAALPVRFAQAQRADRKLALDWLAATRLLDLRVRIESGGARHEGQLASLDLETLELATARGRERFPLELVQALERA